MLATSGGSVTINSSDPFAAPLIDPALLSNRVDIVVVREAIRSARRFLTAPAWEGYLAEALNTANTDDELDDYIRQGAVSFFHPVATAAMSPVGADWGVVDPDLKVKGVLGLRVVDAAVAVRVPEHVFAYARSDCGMSSHSRACQLHILPQLCMLLRKGPAILSRQRGV